ncbi:MAG: hypothetical protein HC830_15350 [Bacteroidetes bacterium]|nr:hypothetical protein [Bacteroidota bacterium]
MKLLGPFNQLLTMDNLPAKGSISDNQLEIIEDAGILSENGVIRKVAKFDLLEEEAQQSGYDYDFVSGNYVALPGWVDGAYAYMFCRKPGSRLCHASFWQNLSRNLLLWEGEFGVLFRIRVMHAVKCCFIFC